MASSPAPHPRDELSREERAQEAQSLLSHPIFSEAVTVLRRGLLERLLAQPPGGPEVVNLHMKAKLLDELIGELRAIVTDVKIKQTRREFPNGG